MSDDHDRDAAKCVLHDGLQVALDKIDDKLEDIRRLLGKGDVTFATLSERVKRLELVVYGGVGLVLTGVAVGVLALVLGKV